MRTRKLSAVLSIPLVFVMLLSACVQLPPTPAPKLSEVHTAAAPTKIPEPTKAPEPTAAPEPTSAPPFPIDLPDDNQVKTIVAGVANLPSQGSGVPAPEAGIEALQAICKVLADEGSLVNPESCTSGFRQERTSTYTLQEDPEKAGVLFQMVSLNEPVNDWLNPEKDWGDKRLVVGGWLTAGDPRVVLLNRKNADTKDLSYELADAKGSSSEKGGWQLRSLQQLPTPPPKDQVIPEPYTFIAPEQSCFSFFDYQACLNRPAPGFGGEANQAVILSAVDELKRAGQLPDCVQVDPAGAVDETKQSGQLPDCVQVDLAGAVASIMGPEAEAQCADYKTCQPSMISAHSELRIEKLPTSAGIPEVIPGVSVVSVITPTKGFATDDKGVPTELPKGSYRVDLLRTDADQWLSRFVGTDGKAYYAATRPLVVSGAPIAGAGAEQGRNLLLFSRCGIWVCKSNGTDGPCTTSWGYCSRPNRCWRQWYSW
jgi:hypothetical protein